MVSAIFLAAGPAVAGDLVGVWNQVDGWGARQGSGNHYSDIKTKFVPKDISVNEFTLKITEQSEDGRAFVGEWCSPGNCEPITGAVKSDGTSSSWTPTPFSRPFPWVEDWRSASWKRDLNSRWPPAGP